MQAQLQALALAYQEAGYFPSVAVSVFDRQGTLCRFALGQAREDSLFDLASLTKLATATLVLQAIEAGRLSLNSQIISLLPQLQKAGLQEQLAGVTVFGLLTHTAGLPAWYPVYSQPDFAAALQAALQKPRPEGVLYSDLGFMLLGLALEQIDAQPLDQILQERLVQPLDLGSMMYRPPAGADILPSGYGNPAEEAMVQAEGLQFAGFRGPGPIIGQVHDGNAWYAFAGVAGHAGIFANLEAVQRLGLHYLHTVSPLLLSSMNEQAEGRGLGWQTGEMYPRGCGHTGFTGTSLYLSHKLGIGCVILSNRCFVTDGQPKLTNLFRQQVHQLVARFAGPRTQEAGA